MIPVKSKIENSSGGIEGSVSFGAKAENLGVLFHILRNQLYKDPILAVIREYGTNGIDAHVMSGKPKEPIVVSLPSQLDCFFKVRDFGKGLTDEEIEEVFASYGESSKRKTQKATGMLGIGCKSGFAYNDSFIVNSYKDGIMTVWNPYIDPSNEGKMARMAQNVTSEKNGIEIIIPVKNTDVAKFKEKALQLFSYFSVPPKIENIDPADQKKFEALCVRPTMFQGENWTITGNRQGSVAVMGNIPYQIETEVFASDISQEMKEIVACGVILNFKIGSLEFAANRESLQYTPFTKKAILNALEKLKNELADKINTQFAGCTTHWEASCLLKKMAQTSSNDNLKFIQTVLKSQCKFNGKPVNDRGYQIGNYSDIQCACYVKRPVGRHSRVGRTSRSTIEAGEKILFVDNDKNYTNGIINRVISQIEKGPYETVYVFSFKDAATKAKFQTETFFDAPMINLSTLPKEKLEDYYPELISLSSLNFSNVKYSQNDFELDLTKKNYNDSASDYWTSSKVDPEKDEGVYFEIERFELSCNGMKHPSVVMSEMFPNMTLFGFKIPTKIYGFKAASAKKVAANPKMVSFKDYLGKQVNDYLANNQNLIQQYTDQIHAQKVLGVYGQRSRDLLKRTKPYTSNKKSPLTLMQNKIREMSCDVKLGNFEQLKNLATYAGSSITTLSTPSYDLSKGLNNIAKRYPLFWSIAMQNDYANPFEGDLGKAAEEYIDMVDVKNP